MSAQQYYNRANNPITIRNLGIAIGPSFFFMGVMEEENFRWILILIAMILPFLPSARPMRRCRVGKQKFTQVLHYSQIHIKFINQHYWISRISQSIFIKFTHYFTFMSWLPQKFSEVLISILEVRLFCGLVVPFGGLWPLTYFSTFDFEAIIDFN